MPSADHLDSTLVSAVTATIMVSQDYIHFQQIITLQVYGSECQLNYMASVVT